MCESLISSGHDNPFSYTPKRLSIFCKLANERKRNDLLMLFNIQRTAYHGKKEDAQKLIKGIKNG